RVSLASGAVSSLLPARAGEALRVIELKRRRGYPAGPLIAAQLAEKGIQAISLGLVLGICALLPGAWAPPLALAGALALAVVALTTAGVAAAPALAFALVYHAVHLVPGTVLGALAISVPWK